VDNGISSHAGVERAHALGIPVVTDHHLPGETLPNAEAIINPNLRECDFPSKSLAGVGVAFYLMLALRTFYATKAGLMSAGWRSEPGGTARFSGLRHRCGCRAAGCQQPHSDLAGLKPHSCRKCRPGIKALLEVANRDAQKLAASDLGFALGPRLNAAGRLDDMSVGVALLLSDNLAKLGCWPANLMR
jgi:single-stranded-DNA-specific exonuclease